MEIRPYQDEAINSIFQYFMCNSGNPVVAMPTGTGKSIVIAEFCRRVLLHYPSQRILVATHVKELIEQNHQKMLQIWPTAPASIFSASVGRREVGKITFAGIQTVAKQAALFGHVDLMLVDECHLVGDGPNTQYLKFISDLRKINPALKVIGFTATAYRLGMGMVTDGKIFTDICFDLTSRAAFNRLIAQGYLSPLVCRKTDEVLDVENVAKQGGEFVQSALQAAVDKAPITAAALKETVRLGKDRRHWLVFAAGVTHADHIAEMLNQMGVSSKIVTGNMSKQDREEALEGFKAGKYRAVVNNNILTTGFDFPSIDMIAMLRPTSSPGLWVQMLGRGLRIAPNKTNCLVLDFARNTARLGPINDPVIPRKKGNGVSAGKAPVRLCPACSSYNHASASVCESCGEIFVKAIKIDASASLQQVVADDAVEVSVFKVDSVTYDKYEKPGKLPTFRATYLCGLRRFHEWVCFEHPGYASHKGRLWWEARAGLPAPVTVEEAVQRREELATPKSIRVWLTKYPEILGHEFE